MPSLVSATCWSSSAPRTISTAARQTSSLALAPATSKLVAFPGHAAQTEGSFRGSRVSVAGGCRECGVANPTGSAADAAGGDVRTRLIHLGHERLCAHRRADVPRGLLSLG